MTVEPEETATIAFTAVAAGLELCKQLGGNEQFKNVVCSCVAAHLMEQNMTSREEIQARVLDFASKTLDICDEIAGGASGG